MEFFTKEEKNMLLESIRAKVHNAVKDIERTQNEEIKLKKQKRIEVLLSCKLKVIQLTGKD